MNMLDNIFLVYLGVLAMRLPTLLIYGVGVVLALVMWRRYPKPCMLVLLAMSLAGLITLISTFLFTYLPRAHHEFGWDGGQLSLIFSVLNVASGIGYATATGMLLAAVFAGRAQPHPRWLPPEEDDRTLIHGQSSDTRIQS